MTKTLVTVECNSSLRKAYEIMRSQKIRHLPVRDEVGGIVGILSDRDLQRAMTPNAEISRGFGDTVEFDESFLVRDFMSWPVRSVADDVALEEVIRRMLNEKVSALLVIDRGLGVNGIITTDDLLKVLSELLQKDPGGSRLSLFSVMNEYGFTSGHCV